MSFIDSYLNLKNKVKLDNAIMDGVASAICQKAVSDLHECISSGSFDTSKIQSDNLYNSSNCSDFPKTAKKRDFETVMSSMKALKKIEQNEQCIKVQSLVETFFAKNLDDYYVANLMDNLKVTSDTSTFRGILFWGVFFTISSVFAKSSSKDYEVIHGEDVLDLCVKVNFQSFGNWVQQAKSKHSDSDIFTNPYSENWLKLFYDNLTFSNEFSDEEIVASLMKFQHSLVDDFNNSMRLELSCDCYQHPKEHKNQEKKTDTIALIIITAVFVFLVLMLVNGYTSR